MNKLKRSERVAAVTRMFCREPGRLFTLQEMVDKFGCAKSTLSEDISCIRGIMQLYGFGDIESINGASGGVRFFPINNDKSDECFLTSFCAMLSSPDRILKGGNLYKSDLFCQARILSRLSEIFVKKYFSLCPDVIIGAENLGLPIAFMVSHSLGKPMITALHNKVSACDGTLLSIHYLSNNGQKENTLSLPFRSLNGVTTALLIGETLQSGDTFLALSTLLKEQNISVVGMGVIIDEQGYEKKLDDVFSLVTQFSLDEKNGIIKIAPSYPL